MNRNIELYFNENDLETYLIVLFDYLQIQKYMEIIYKKTPNQFIVDDENEDEFGFSENLEYYIIKKLSPKTRDILLTLTTTYPYKKYKYTDYLKMTFHELEEEKKKLING